MRDASTSIHTGFVSRGGLMVGQFEGEVCGAIFHPIARAPEKPARSSRCKFYTVKAWPATPAPCHAPLIARSNGEALVRGVVGWVLSRESGLSSADRVGKPGRQHGYGRHGEP
ncbi:MAG: hypothetical protein ABSC06_32130, partial [Rhodopila sp.]